MKLLLVLCALGFHQALGQVSTSTRAPTTSTAGPSSSTARPGCAPWFVARPNSNSCYYFINNAMNWFDADQYCTSKIPRSYNVHLASIETAVEQQWIISHIQGDTDLNNNNFWIGGDNIDRHVPYTWTWTGQPFSYTNWAPNEPNDSGKCVHMWYQQNYRWDDSDCTYDKRFGVCEYTL